MGDYKSCHNCGKRLLAAAVRCPKCKTVVKKQQLEADNRTIYWRQRANNLDRWDKAQGITATSSALYTENRITLAVVGGEARIDILAHNITPEQLVAALKTTKILDNVTKVESTSNMGSF